jgi:hypothetical protein
MKYRTSLFLLLLISFFSLSSFVQASAVDGETIIVTEKPHQALDGVFRDDALAQLLTPTGQLGKLIYVPIKNSRTWIIDAALVDQVFAMTTQYKLVNEAPTSGVGIAQNWLAQLRYITSRNDVIALPYGNPNISLARNLAPNEVKIYYDFGNERLSQVLGRSVITDQKRVTGAGTAHLNNEQTTSYSLDRTRLTALSRVVVTPELKLLRAQLAFLLSPSLNAADREFFISNASNAVNNEVSKLKINGGKYRLTSSNVKVPVTVENKFEIPVTVDLSLTQSNFKIYTPNIQQIVIPAKSKLQLSMDVTVIAPGNTDITAQLTDTNGNPVSDPALLSLNLTVIDTRVAWFTTGAAIILLLGAVAQSVRRVRRSRV